MELGVAAALVCVAALAVLLVFMIRRNGSLTAENVRQRGLLGESELQNAVLNQRLVSQQQLLEVSERQATIAQQRLQNELTTERIRLGELFETERREQEKKYTQVFENLSSGVLERKTQSLKEQSKESIEAMLKPFAESINAFRQRIEAESKQRFALEKEVARLAELNLKMSQQTNNLTSALKGNSKTQGDWGEMILETMLESSGLKRDIHFRVQESIRTIDGNLLRPDVILNLPEGKEVVIDSKVSLRAYIAFTESQNSESTTIAQGAHVAAIRSHINELGGKKYNSLVASPDFVIMFVPNEPAFLVALQADNELWNYAYSKGVILSSPTNLFAILRIVDELWKRDSQSKNALEIARQGGDLYDKFVTFTEVFLSIGASLEKSTQQYDRALGQLSQGKGNLTKRAETLRDLGLKTAKSLPSSMVEDR